MLIVDGRPMGRTMPPCAGDVGWLEYALSEITSLSQELTTGGEDTKRNFTHSKDRDAWQLRALMG